MLAVSPPSQPSRGSCNVTRKPNRDSCQLQYDKAAKKAERNLKHESG